MENFLDLGTATWLERILGRRTFLYTDDESVLARRFFKEAGIECWINDMCFNNKETGFYIMLVSFKSKQLDRALEIMKKVDDSMLLKHSHYYKYKSETFPAIVAGLIQNAIG